MSLDLGINFVDESWDNGDQSGSDQLPIFGQLENISSIKVYLGSIVEQRVHDQAFKDVAQREVGHMDISFLQGQSGMHHGVDGGG